MYYLHMRNGGETVKKLDKAKINYFLAGLGLLFLICCVIWWMLPVHFVNGDKVNQIKTVTVYNNNSGNSFEINDIDDVNTLISTINQVPFRKYSIASADLAAWYNLSFKNDDGSIVESLTIQNYNIVKKEAEVNIAIFFSCDFQLEDTANFLESTESTLFPDFHRDPDFTGF